MEVINNRYRLVELLEQNRIASIYLAMDLFHENRYVQLNLLSSEYTPSSLIHFFEKQFIAIKNLSSKRIARNEQFGAVTFVDNKPYTEKAFFYTVEFDRKNESYFSLIQQFSIDEVIEQFIEICSAVHYVHTSGFIYGALNLKAIYPIKQGNRLLPKLKDLATIELEKYSHHDLENSYYNSPKLLAGIEPNIETDMYALGLILLAMITKQAYIENPKQALQSLEENLEQSYLAHDRHRLHNLLPIIKKMIGTEEDYPYLTIQDMITELSERLDTDISIIDQEALDKLHFHTRIIGRDEELSYVLNNVQNMMSYKPSKRIIFVQGENGIGKTRFLQELHYLLELRKVTIYASFHLGSTGNSKNLWLDILQKLISQTDYSILRKYHAELVKYFPELEKGRAPTSLDYVTDGNSEYRLLNRIGAFINESLQGRPAVFLIDDLHLADRFTLNLLHYLSTNNTHQNNLMFIVSGELREDGEKDFLENYHLMKKRLDTSIIRLDLLTEEQVAEMIMQILSLSYKPLRLTVKIYARSFGNPLFIQEIMKDLYSRGLLQINKDNGMWSVLLDYNALEIPESIEQVLVNQLRDLEKIALQILETIAIYNKPISKNVISEYLELDEVLIHSTVDHLVQKGIVHQLVSDYGFLFDIYNKVLKRIVYDAIDAKKKITMHAHAAALMEKASDTKIEELIHHYEGAHNWEKCLDYYLDIAKQLHAQHEIRKEVQYLQKAEKLMVNPYEKTEILLKIGGLCIEINQTEQALKNYEYALEIAEKHNLQDLILKVYLELGNLFATSYKVDNLKHYLQKIDENFPIILDKESRLEYKRLHALLLNIQNHLDEADIILKEIIAESGDDFPKIMGRAYLLLGFSSAQNNRYDEAKAYFKKAMKLLEHAGYLKGYLGAINNIGIISQSSFRNEFDEAINYFEKVRDISEKYGIFETEIQALNSIGRIHASAYHFSEAYDHFKYALEKAQAGRASWLVSPLYNQLCFTSAEMAEYKRAFKYYHIIEALHKEDSSRELNLFEYYNTSMNLFHFIGDFERADEFGKLVVEFNKGRDNMYSDSAITYQKLHLLRKAPPEQLKKIISNVLALVEKIPHITFNIKVITTALIVLSERGYYSLTSNLSKKLEELFTDKTPDALKARYYYFLGTKDSSKKSINYLKRGLKLAKQGENRELIARILMVLGEYAFKAEKWYGAANYYLESTELVKSLVEGVPKQYQLTYVNHHHYAKGFIGLERTYNWISKEQHIVTDKENGKQGQLSQADLNRFLAKDYVSIFLEHEEFMEYIREQHMMNYSKEIRTAQDMILKVGPHTIKNINMLLHYLTGITLATRGIIITDNQKEELAVLSTTDGNRELPQNRYMINLVHETREAVILDAKEQKLELDLLPKGLQSIMCIPITQNHGNSSPSILGYIYLETDLLVNNFNEAGVEKCKEVMGFLATMLEQHQLKLSASIDKLTGTLTRKYLDDALLEAIDVSKRTGEPFSIVMFDLDRFKQVNDRYGHQIGDEVLRTVSHIVKDMLDESYTLGRYGGEEFITILPNIKTEEAVVFADKVREEIAAQQLLGDKFDITVSIGIATYPLHGQRVKALIEKADQALYVAKEKGRNNTQVWYKDFLTTSKPQNKLAGILTGDDIKDSRNVLAMVELIQLPVKNLSTEEKIYQFLGRMIEISEAQVGYILLYTPNGEKVYGRRAQEEGWLEQVSIEQDILHSVILEERGLYTITWDVKDKHNKINALPDWDSILAVPIMVNGSVLGAIYLRAPSRFKEFGADDLNMVSIYSSLLAGMI